MHTIDLLKGQGIPAKTTLGSLTFVAFTAGVPIVIAAIMFSLYLLNNEYIKMGQDEIKRHDIRIAELDPDVSKTKVLENERNLLLSKLTEVSRCVDAFVQWSPVLIAIADEMPSQMIMDEFTTRSQVQRVTARRDKNSDKPAEIPIPKRTITLNISGTGKGSYNTVVQNYQDRLQSSVVFETKFKALPFPISSGAGDNQIESYVMDFESITQ